MLKLIYGLLTLTMIISCDKYQVGEIQISPSSRGLIQSQTSNSNTFNENIQELLDQYVVYTDEDQRDTLVKYDKLFIDKDKSPTLDLRKNLYTQVAKFEYQSASANQKKAFLINAYNFLAIETIITNYLKDGKKIESIINIGEYEFAAFDEIQYTVANKLMTLNQIEKQTLKPLMINNKPKGYLDARFHFAVICAAKGCPILMKEAFNAIELDRQLQYATEQGLKENRNLEIKSDRVLLTSLFDWYKQDFLNHSVDGAANSISVDNFIFEMTQQSIEGLSKQYVDYDWSLNKASEQ